MKEVSSCQGNIDTEVISGEKKKLNSLLLLLLLFRLIVWTALFDKRSLPWRSVAEASLVNHERFPGRDVLKSALLRGAWRDHRFPEPFS